MSNTQQLLAVQKVQLRARMADVRAQIAAVKATSAPLQVELDAAISQQNALDVTIADIAAKIDVIEQPHLHALKLELSALAQAESAIKVIDFDQAAGVLTLG